ESARKSISCLRKLKGFGDFIKNILVIFLLVFISSKSGALEYTAKKFFEDIPSSEIETEESLPDDQKSRIVNSGYHINADACADGGYDWYVDKLKKYSLLLSQCRGGSVAIFVYPKSDGGSLVVNVSILGNHGQSQSFKFYEVDSNGVLVGMVDKKVLE